MPFVGVGIVIGLLGLSANALQDFFAQLQQVLTLDDPAKGILDNDILG